MYYVLIDFGSMSTQEREGERERKAKQQERRKEGKKGTEEAVGL